MNVVMRVIAERLTGIMPVGQPSSGQGKRMLVGLKRSADRVKLPFGLFHLDVASQQHGHGMTLRKCARRAALRRYARQSFTVRSPGYRVSPVNRIRVAAS